MQTIERKPRGAFDRACEHAAKYANRHKGGLELAETFLGRAGWGNSTFGIEYVSCAGNELAYLNTGDTYATTVGREGDGDVFVCSWGDWLETVEKEHCQAENVTRCAYCGEFTPLDDSGAWHETICEHCTRFVDGNHALPQPEND